MKFDKRYIEAEDKFVDYEEPFDKPIVQKFKDAGVSFAVNMYGDIIIPSKDVTKAKAELAKSKEPEIVTE